MADPARLVRQAREAIDDGDPPALVAALTAMSDRQRREARDTLRDRIHERYRPPQARRDWPPTPASLDLLVEVGTVRAAEIGWGWWRLSPDRTRRDHEIALVTEVLAARPAAVHRALVRGVCEVDGGSAAAWPVLRALQQRGVVTDVDDATLAVGLVRAVWSMRPAAADEVDWRDPPADVLVDILRDDASLAPLVLEALGHAPALDAAHGPWPAWLAAAVDAGVLPRDRVLATALRTQDGDVRPSTAHLLRKLVSALRPTDAELAEHEAELTRILADAHPSAQGQAAEHLRRLADAGRLVDPSAVVAATAGALTGTQKAAAGRVLRLLDALSSASVATEEVAVAASLGLGHAHGDIQTAALDLVQRLVGDRPPPGVREQAGLHLDTVAPSLRGRLAELAGVQELDDVTLADDDAPSVAELTDRLAALPAPVSEDLGVRDVVDAVIAGEVPAPAAFAPELAPAGTPIAPVDDATELGELLGFLLAGSGSPVDLERAIDGMARIDGRRAPAEVRAVVTRHAEQTMRHGAGEGGGTVAFLISLSALDWAAGSAPGQLEHLRRAGGRRGLARVLGRRTDSGLLHDLIAPPAATHDFYAQPDGGAGFAGLLGVLQGRLVEAVLASQDEPRPTLALPEDDRGWIEPATFAERVRRLTDAGARAGRFEAVAALLRVRTPAALRGALPTTGPAAPIAAAIDGAPDADPALRRALERHGPGAVGDLTLAADEHRPGLDRSTPWFVVPDPGPWRRDDPIGQLLRELAERESRHAASWWNAQRNVLPEAERVVTAWAPTALPGSVPLLAAAVTRTIVVDVDADRSSSALDTFLAWATDGDVPLIHPWHLVLAVALGGGNRVAGITAADVVGAAAEDGRLDADELATHLAWLHGRGVVKLNRVTARLGPLAESSVAAAAALRRVGQRWLGRLEEPPRDLHHLLELLETCCGATAAGIDDPGARACLERAATGRSKRAAAAGRLLARPAVPPAGEHERVASAALRRAERWSATPRTSD